jgi:hypothetical protein
MDNIPNLKNAMMGQILDKEVKTQVENSDDPDLQRLYTVLNGEPGPDVIDPYGTREGGPSWYDFTTVHDWENHTKSYSSFGNGYGVTYDPAALLGDEGAGSGEPGGGGGGGGGE